MPRAIEQRIKENPLSVLRVNDEAVGWIIAIVEHPEEIYNVIGAI